MKNVLLGGVATILMILLSCFFSCEYNSEEELYGLENCDTTDVTWEGQIKAILQQNCVECHNAEKHYNEVRHDTYEEELKVVNDGRLNGVVNHLAGYPQMPYQRPQLPDCELNLINAWIEKGAPEK